MQTSEHINEIAAALAKAQGAIQNPEKDKVNPHFQSRYATLAAGLEVVRPALSEHGLSVIQVTSIDGEAMIVTTRLMHSSGQWIEGTYPVAKIGQHQQMGGALTYARRYALFAIIGIAPEDEDGNDAAEAAPPSRRPAPGVTAKNRAREEAEAYVAKAKTDLQNFAVPAELGAWWRKEKRNHELHFGTDNADLYEVLKAAMLKHGEAISQGEAA